MSSFSPSPTSLMTPCPRRAPADNVVVRTVGDRRRNSALPRSPLGHRDEAGILDFERAAKITGSRFTVYFGAGALLERALINFMLDIHTREKGFKEVIPPFIANEASLTRRATCLNSPRTCSSSRVFRGI